MTTAVRTTTFAIFIGMLGAVVLYQPTTSALGLAAPATATTGNEADDPPASPAFTEFWELPATMQTAWQLEHRDESIESYRREAQTRIEQKQCIAQEVAQERLPLLTAAAWFRQINLSSPGFDAQRFQDAYPGGSFEERCCRQVIAYVDYFLQSQSRDAAPIVQRLEAELAQQLQAGTLRLPVVN